MDKRIVITGIGVIASNGIGKQSFWDALKTGLVGYKPITLFDSSLFLAKIAGEASDFDPKEILGQKGLRTFDRSTCLLIAAAQLALEDCGYTITDENSNDVGVVAGTTLGSIKSITDFDVVTLKEGPRNTNPALFSNTVINSPASQVSIWHHIKGFNTTISTGFTASLDAIEYASNFLEWDRAKVVLAGGVEELCPQTYYGFHALQFLSGSKPGSEFINCPFDKRRNGITFGEGACIMILEDYDHAKERGAVILAEILSYESNFDPYRINKYNPKATGLIEVMKGALNKAGLTPKDIDYICANANSSKEADRAETKAIEEVMGSYAKKVPVSSIKSMIGECFSVSGAMAVAAACGAMQEGFIPPNVHYKDKDPDCDLNIVGKMVKRDVNTVLISNFGPNGSNSCMILRKV